MKLKFTDEIKAAIERIAALPSEPQSPSDHNKPLRIIQETSAKLTKMTAAAPPNKFWNKMRREQSFLFSLYMAHQNRLHEKPDERAVYIQTVKAFKSIQNETILTNRGFIRLAMSYGCLRLSDKEIETLLQLNKVDFDHLKENEGRVFAQICGCRVSEDASKEVIPFVSHEKAEFYGVYLGKPGNYRSMSDHVTYSSALKAAAEFVEQGKAEKVDDKTFHD